MSNFTNHSAPLDTKTIKAFRNFVWNYYASNRRTFPWRETTDPYHILVSEVMLQQTQTKRVVGYYNKFLLAYPTVHKLAQAPLRDVLIIWQGLGYNRRAKYLHTASQRIVQDFEGNIPTTLLDLQGLEGVGPNTAGAVMAYAFNQPAIFIETNIRSVFLHTFFRDRNEVSDKSLVPFVEQTMDTQNPREWYYALTDYGVYIKSQTVNPSQKSKHYVMQSRFEGSDRQLRARIIKLIIANDNIKTKELRSLDNDQSRIETIVESLIKDGLIVKNGSTYSL